LKTTKFTGFFQVVGWVIVADQDEALELAAAVEPGLGVFR
jgi:hypothetical protein